MSTVSETIDLIRASERLLAISIPLRAVLEQVDSALEVAPELQPELDEIKARIDEAVAHVMAANAVLAVRLSLLEMSA